MNVTCPQCQTVFRVDPAKVPEAGVRARCSVCPGIFWVHRGAEPEPTHSPPFLAPRPAAAAATASPMPSAPRTPAPAPPVAAPPAPTPAAPAPQQPRAPAPPPGMPRPMTAPPASAPYAPAGAPSPRPRPAAPPPPATSPPFSRPAAAPAPPAPPRPPAQAPAGAVAGPRAPAKRPTNPFLSQDPEARARRLARALVSDIVVYHPAKRRDGLRDGSLKLLFEDEIRKSWEEYVDQVGRELAEGTNYFNDALNEILADGQPVFP